MNVRAGKSLGTHQVQPPFVSGRETKAQRKAGTRPWLHSESGAELELQPSLSHNKEQFFPLHLGCMVRHFNPRRGEGIGEYRFS